MNFCKATRNKNDQYFGILDSVMDVYCRLKRKSVQECDDFMLIERQRMSVMQYVLRDEATRYFTQTICLSALSIADAFHILKKRFMTPVHIEKDITVSSETHWSSEQLKKSTRTNPRLNFIIFLSKALRTYK